MFKPLSWFTKVSIAATLLLVTTAQPSFAQRGGHGGMGGGGMGGGGMGHGGTWHGGHGGWGGGGFYGYGLYGGFYGYPYDYGPYYYAGLPYYYPPPVAPPLMPPYYQPAPIGSAVTPGEEAAASPRTVPDNTATIEIRVPADAEVWFDGTKTKQQGIMRLFSSPPLPPGKTFTYEIRALWNANGIPATKSYQVQVEAGKRSWVNFVDAISDGK